MTTTTNKTAPAAAAVDARTIANLMLSGELSIEQATERLASGKLDAATFAQAMALYTADKAAAAARAPAALKCKVTEKGGISVYGLNARFPVTLYADQWDRLLAYADTLRQFMQANSASLSRK